MALHINDLVSVEKEGQREVYRVQALEPPKLQLRLHTAASLSNKEELIRKAISVLITEYKLRLHPVNAIGKMLRDQESH